MIFSKERREKKRQQKEWGEVRFEPGELVCDKFRPHIIAEVQRCRFSEPGDFLAPFPRHWVELDFITGPNANTTLTRVAFKFEKIELVSNEQYDDPFSYIVKERSEWEDSDEA